MSLKLIAPTFDQRVPVTMAGNPLVVSMPYNPVDATVGFPRGVARIGNPADTIYQLKRLYDFHFEKNPSTGLVDVDLTEILPYLPGIEADFPVLHQHQELDIIRQFSVALELVLDVDAPDNLIISSRQLNVLNAGIAGRLAAQYGQNYLSDGFSRSMQFLTHQPREKLLPEGQPDYLYYLHNFSAEDRVQVAVKYTDRNGSTSLYYPHTFTAKPNRVYGIMAGHAQLSMPGSAQSYEICIVNSKGKRLTEVRTYTIDRSTPYQDSLALVFQNSFGVYDVISVNGEKNVKSSFERTFSQLQNPAAGRPKTKTTRSIQKKEYTYRTIDYPPGWMPYFTELLNSKRVATFSGTQYEYLNMTSSEFESVNTLEPSYALEFTAIPELPESSYQF